MIYAVPSFRRCDLFKQTTYEVLVGSGVKPEQVYVFVSDEADRLAYQWVTKVGSHLIYERPLTNIVEKFNFIHNYFDIGSEVVFVEDDIESLVIKTGKNSVETFNDLPRLAEQMFSKCHEHKAKLWGISSNANPFYMKLSTYHGFKFVVANLFGFISTRDPFLEVSQLCKSDYERTLLYFVKHGVVCRYDGVAAKTKNYKNAGGLQDIKDQRADLETQACKYLVDRFPHLVEHNVKKSGISMYDEIKLKRVTAKMQGVDWLGLQKIYDRRVLETRS